jgi:hypothetical protein
VNLDAIIQQVIDDNRYMTMATAGADGRPWVSPVFFAADAYRDFYWMSSPEVTHSRNLAVRPQTGIVLFDSRAPVGTGDEGAVYMAATAAQVPDNEIEYGLTVFPGPAERGGGSVAPSGLRAPAPYRLYRATVTEYFVLCPRAAGERCHEHGLAADHRTRVEAF